MNNKRLFDSIEERLDFIEFRQQLLFNNDKVSEILFEYQLTEQEYESIMDLMDLYRSKIDNHEDVHYASFERDMYSRVPFVDGDYHFCEYITRAFYENYRWEEVFLSLYGDEPKYRHLKGQQK